MQVLQKIKQNGNSETIHISNDFKRKWIKFLHQKTYISIMNFLESNIQLLFINRFILDLRTYID